MSGDTADMPWHAPVSPPLHDQNGISISLS